MNLLITGCGSLATAYTKAMIDKYTKIIIYSRDYQKHEKLKSELDPRKAKKVRFFIGDIRDLERLKMALCGADCILHTAAIKDLEACEFNCLETIKTNIIGTQNIVEAAIANDVTKTVFISSDKAINAINSYGISKAMGEKLIINANYLSAGKQKFTYVRYGNIAGSSGSVIPKFINMYCDGHKYLPLTDVDCTRFWYDMDNAIELINNAFLNKNLDPLIPAMKSFYIKDLIKTMNCKYKIIGLKKGEKIHEEIKDGISSKDGPFMTVDEIKSKINILFSEVNNE